jgi:ribose/xylose/arabinose/galactoside ABC-type transport system permease subunit
MNSDNQIVRPMKWLTNRSLRVIAFISIAAAILTIMLCAEVYVRGVFTWIEQNQTNPEIIKPALEMFKNAFFGIVPAMSGLLLINSLLLWACSRKFYTNSDT